MIIKYNCSIFEHGFDFTLYLIHCHKPFSMPTLPDYIKVEANGNIGALITVYSSKSKGSDLWTCSIPSLDLDFHSTSEGEIKERAEAMFFTFCEYWTVDRGWNKFYLKMIALGFKAKKAHQINSYYKKFKRNSPARAKLGFKKGLDVIPEQYDAKLELNMAA